MNITLKELLPSDSNFFSDALEILNRTQGRDLFDANYLHKLFGKTENYIVGAFLNKEIIGIGVAQIITDFDFYIQFDNNIKVEMSNKKVASFSTLAITESMQGKGIGQKISKLRLDWVKKNNCTVVLGTSWVSGLKHTSDRVFEKMGFKAIKRVENFFVESSLKKPFDCPGCEKAPCICGAILYRLDL